MNLRRIGTDIVVRPTIHIRGVDFVDTLAAAIAYAYDDIDDIPNRVSKTSAAGSLQAFLAECGLNGVDGWADDLDDRTRAAVIVAARDYAARNYPDLY